jgi:hypothetical protein
LAIHPSLKIDHVGDGRNTSKSAEMKEEIRSRERSQKEEERTVKG